MDPISKDDIRALIDEHRAPCISLYMPTHRMLETQQDQIRFKNLLRQAEEELSKLDLRAPAARRLLKPAQKLLDDPFFWEHLADGLAMFIAPGVLRCFRLAYELQELAVVAERFHLRPLLPALTHQGRFYILALSQNEVRLLRGTRLGASEVELDTVPHSLRDALKYEQPEKDLRFHTRTPAARGRRRVAIFHGHGAGVEESKGRIFRYFRQIDKGLHEVLQEERAPLVLAGVDYLLPIYRAANSYPYVLERGITGNPEGLRPQELPARVWPIVQPHFEKAERDALAQFRELAGTPRTCSQVKEVVLAAHAGKVDSLLVAVGRQQWGAFDPNHGEVHVYPERRPGSQDLLDFAAIHTLLHAGRVHAVAPERIPNHALVAAIFRY